MKTTTTDTAKYDGADWFESWFDSAHYHRLYAYRDNTEAAEFIDQLVSRLCPCQGTKALDLGCGAGRHSRELAARGFDVVGLDLSAHSIERAKFAENAKLHFRRHAAKVTWFPPPDKRHTSSSEFSVEGIKQLPRVDIVYAHANMQADLIEAALKFGAKGLVVAGVGDGNMIVLASESFHTLRPCRGSKSRADGVDEVGVGSPAIHRIGIETRPMWTREWSHVGSRTLHDRS